ncbi:hypothetical protein [Klebsiella variicola]|uniref:hypothetical protein n=1 Tax=Klebsiella variicola TaxID=244366 RepID=UPI001D100FB1|nr:hypothetical protein [Klebsiella variicola]
MTKSTITRERLEWLSQISCRDDIEDIGGDEIRELARMALAAMDSEPVGKPFMYGIADPDGNAYIDEFCVSEDLGLVEDTVNELNYDREEGDELNYSVVALYRHAQQPVVPNGLRLALSNAGIAAPESDEMLAATCEKHIQALVTWVKDRKPFQSAPVVPSFEEWLSAANRKPLGWVKDAMREAYDACRAAMIQPGTLTNEGTRQVDELTMWIKRLVRSLKNANPDSKLPREAMDYLTAKGLISVGDVLR